MTHSASTPFSPSDLRASDADRDELLRQLRGHWVAGRLELEEYEDRCEQAARARYVSELHAAARELPPPPPVFALTPVYLAPPPPPVPRQPTGIASLALGVVGLVLVFFSLGFLYRFSLPLSIVAWGLGYGTRRRHRGHVGSTAVAGEIVGIVGTVFGCLALWIFVT